MCGLFGSFGIPSFLISTAPSREDVGAEVLEAEGLEPLGPVAIGALDAEEALAGTSGTWGSEEVTVLA